MKLKSIYREGSSFRPFLISIVCMGLAYGLYKGIQDNYLAEVVSMGEFERGVAEFFRELPGLLLVFILAALYMFSAESIFKIGAVIMVIGMGMLALVKPTVVLATLGICIFSLGEHIQLGMKNAMSLEYAKPKMGGQALGIQNSANQAGTLVGFLIVLLVFSIIASNVENFKLFFLISAGIMVIGTVCSFRIKGKTAQDPSKTRFYFNKKYTKYYFLEVFYGARKQVFFTFGPYVLILFYGAKTATISLLFAISAICGFFLAPVVGKIIDKIGYKIVMVSDTLILVVVCFFYGFAHHFFPMNVAFIVCCVNYVLDSIISLASMAANVYVQDISDSPEETRATISTGISVNHLITILIALFGGWIWKTLGIETLFILSAVLGLCNSAYAATIRVKKK
ncbi:MAG: MFS transporter [Lachnospiraceae bacterium]|nr:MFS transporter [Lachnospiraceae bacterium]